MQSRHRVLRACTLISAGIFGLSASALAAAPKVPPSHNAEVSATGFVPPPQSRQQRERSTNRVQITDGNETFMLEIEDGRILRAQHNGEEIPPDRLRVTDRGVEVLDGDGKVVSRFDIQLGAGGEIRAQGRAQRQEGRDGPRVWWTQNDRGNEGGNRGPQEGEQGDQPEPRAMIGVTLAEPDALLRGHFGFEPGEATLIAAVFEGLPGDEAGLEPYDLVVAIEGNRPAGEQELRQAIRDRSAGDRLRLTVLRQGRERDVELTLAPFDAERLSQTESRSIERDRVDGPIVLGGPMPGWFGNDGLRWEMSPEHAEQLETEIRLQMESARGAGQAREQAEALRQELEQNRQRLERDLRLRVAPPPPPAPPTPGRPATPRAQGDEPIMIFQAPGSGREMGDRLDRLEERLDRLERLLERALEQRERDRDRDRERAREDVPRA